VEGEKAMKRVVEMKTGLFPDAETVATAVAACAAKVEVTRLDVAGLGLDDEAGWQRVAEVILGADLIVTL
jgi:hypothetical protein